MNRSNTGFRILSAALAVALGAGLYAQSSADTGSIKGRITDDKGAPLPGAVVKARGSQGTKGAETDSAGNYVLPFLTPGTYEVTVSMDGFNTVVQSGVGVIPQSSVVQSFKLAAGAGDIIKVSGNRINTDVTDTRAVTSINLTDAIQNFARPVELTSAFDFAPGVNTNGNVGGANSGNVSVSGATGLENQYLIGGVNITNSGYGGIGAYDSVRGAQGVGVTTEFLENIDIVEGGFDADYGGALGGVFNATVKSGSNDWHAGITAYYTPRSLEGGRATYNLDGFGGATNSVGENKLYLAFSLGGPIIRDKLFFFVSYNPTWDRQYNEFLISSSDLAKDSIVAPNANREYDFGNARVDNYAGHLTWNLTEKHKLDLTIFGSPTTQSGNMRGLGTRVDPSGDINIPLYPASATGVPQTDSVVGNQGDYKVRDYSAALKYFGTLAPWMNVEAQLTYHKSQVVETPTAASDVYRYNDIRRTQIYNAQARSNITPITSPAAYGFGGFGRYQQGSNDKTTTYLLKISNNFSAAGSHELKWGVDYEHLQYSDDGVYTGPKGANGAEIFLDSAANLNSYVRLRTGSQAQVRCRTVNPAGTTFLTACPTNRYRLTRGNFNPPTPLTENKELNLFVQDKWQIHNVTLKLGARYSHSKVSNPVDFFMRSSRTGAPLQAAGGVIVGDGVTGEFKGSSYTFKGEISPRLGISWDVLGNGKSKIFFNFARLYERIPNDLAVRSFGSEFGLTRVTFSNPDLTAQNGAPLLASSSPTTVADNTRLPYKDDVILGYEFELAPQLIMKIQGNWRKQGRVLEDTQSATVESIENLYYNSYIPYCLNCSAGQTELFPGEGYSPFLNYNLANIGENTVKGFTDVYTGAFHPVDFGTPKSKYKALSLTIQKQRGEGEHLSMQATYRISKIFGNYEGLYRSDNGQQDPNISSLYDFPNSHLLRSQYFNGPLNSDTPHILHVNIAYDDLFIKNFSTAVTFKWASGTLRTPYLAHPNYQNAGEIPGSNPQYYQFDLNGDGYSDLSLLKDYTAVNRGSNGRNADTALWDIKFAYKWNLGKSGLDFSVLVLNVFNDTHVASYDEFVENSTGVLNPGYGQPSSVLNPRTIRLGVKWSF